MYKACAPRTLQHSTYPQCNTLHVSTPLTYATAHYVSNPVPNTRLTVRTTQYILSVAGSHPEEHLSRIRLLACDRRRTPRRAPQVTTCSTCPLATLNSSLPPPTHPAPTTRGSLRALRGTSSPLLALIRRNTPPEWGFWLATVGEPHDAHPK
jgi:hypothetical protein